MPAVSASHPRDDQIRPADHPGWLDVVRPEPGISWCLSVPPRRELRLFFDPRDCEVQPSGPDIVLVFVDGARLILAGLADLIERGEAGDLVTAEGAVMAAGDLARGVDDIDGLARALADAVGRG